MRRVQFVSLHGTSEVDVPDVRLGFKNGDIKSVTDEQAAILLTNPNFVAVDEAPSAPSYYKAASVVVTGEDE